MKYEFESYSFDTDSAELLRNGEVVHLEPKSFDLLGFLIENQHRVVSKDEIFDHIWPGVFVSDASISSAIKQIRQVLEDSGDAQRVVRTVRGKGFRFVAELTRKGEPAATAAAVKEASQEAPEIDVGPPCIAVLSFAEFRDTGATGTIANGLVAEIISALSRLKGLKVISHSTSFQVEPIEVQHATLRQRLGIRYVLSGTVSVSGRNLRVTTELSETRNERVLWANVHSTSIDDVFLLREEIVRDVCGAVNMYIPHHEADRLSSVPTEDLDAWGHFYIGLRHLLWRRGTENDLAVHHMQEALKRDPGFARAHSALAYAELEELNFGSEHGGTGGSSSGTDLAERGVDLDPYDPFCNLVLGRAKWSAGDVDGAISWAERSVKLDPNFSLGYYELSKLHAIACEGDLAEEAAANALTLSPLDPVVASMLSARALAAFVREDQHNALRYANASMRAPNRHAFVTSMAVAIYGWCGETKRAENAVAQTPGWNKKITLARLESLFSLHDRARHDALVGSLRQLGLR